MMRTLAGLLMFCGLAAAPPEPVPWQVDGSRSFAISPFVYGHNHPTWEKQGWTATISRAGGNRLTAYNWETNASNAGSDWHHQNDDLLGGDVPGEAIRSGVAASHDHGAACIVTIPIIGRVAADKNGGGDVKQTPDYLNKRFFVRCSKKDGPFADPPDLTDGKVYQDEFVAWLEKKFPKAREDRRPTIFYALDNEPELWSHTPRADPSEKARLRRDSRD
jgi:hypothetical protein